MSYRINYKIVIVALFVLLLTMLFIVQTYALFETNASADSAIDVGKWIILLNGNNVTETKTLTLSDFTYVNGSHTEDGYFAPGSSAYFDLTIDATNSDVSVIYQLDVDDTQLANYPNIYFSVTDLATNEELTTNSYSGIIMLNDTNRVKTLRINLVWDNQQEYDEVDTSLIGEELKFTINANFKQYIGD